MKSILDRLTVASKKGTRITFIVPSVKVHLLNTNCFLGTDRALSGNSCRWKNLSEMIRDPILRSPFGDILLDIVEYCERDERGRELLSKGFTERITIPFEVPVGWTTSVSREHINGARLAPRAISNEAWGMVVLPEDVTHPAPLTNLVSMTLAVKEDFKVASEVAIRLLDMHFGKDLGPLVGDFTGEVRVPGDPEPCKYAFFTPLHPGSDELILLDP